MVKSSLSTAKAKVTNLPLSLIASPPCSLVTAGRKRRLCEFCINCEQPGAHKATLLRSRGRKRNKKPPTGTFERNCKKTANSQRETATLVTTNLPTRYEAYLATVPSTIPPSPSADKQTWIIDLGATAHMAKDRTIFTTFCNLPAVHIKSASASSHLQALGCGTIKFDVDLQGATTMSATGWELSQTTTKPRGHGISKKEGGNALVFE